MQKKLKGLDPQEYEHPLDREALNALESIPGVKAICKKVYELWYEKFSYIDSIGSALLVTEDNLPRVHSLFIKACSILDIQEIPPLYMKQIASDGSFTVNAYASGIYNPYVVLTTRSVEALDDIELILFT